MSTQQAAPMVAMPLPKAKKTMAMAGCCCLMLAMTFSGIAMNTILSPILSSMNAMQYVSLFSVFATLGVAIMTPVGAKLGDIVGRRNILVFAPLVFVICTIGMAFIRALVPFMICRLLLGFAQGAFTATPYILVSLINERKDVPKAMGMLATSIAVGTFVGGLISGALADAGSLEGAILVAVVPYAIGIVLLSLSVPNNKPSGKVNIDVPGIAALSVALAGIILPLNFGSSMGWTSPIVLGGLIVGIIGLVALVKVEGKSANPIIPLRLFSNKLYTVLLLVGLMCYFYMTAINIYASMAAIRVLGASTSVTGTLQMGRTLITVLLPTVAGAWVGKKAANSWKAMAIATACAAIPMLFLAAVAKPGTSPLLFILAIAVTGLAESFRSVSITPAAQRTLPPQDIAIGTGLINFMNSLAPVIASASMGVVYNMQIVADPTNVENIQRGVRSVFLLAATVLTVGFIVVLTVVRPLMTKNAEEK